MSIPRDTGAPQPRLRQRRRCREAARSFARSRNAHRATGGARPSGTSAAARPARIRPIDAVAASLALVAAALLGGDKPVGWTIVALTTGLMLAVAMLAARAGRRSGSIHAVTSAATRLATGERSVRVEARAAKGDIGALIGSFNAMAHAIDTGETERRLLTAGISHELRTPLTILKGRLHGIEDGVIAVEDGETHRLLRQVDRILRIVDDLDTFARADEGRLTLDRTSVDLGPLLRAAAADLAPLVGRHAIRFAFEIAPMRVRGDPIRLSQIVTNLLTNAAKHSAVGGEIVIRLAQEAGRAVISILDEGPGFPPEEADRLFRPFWRSSRNQPAGRPGSGMGLAVSLRLAQAHRGRIRAENRTDRSGACFSLILPLPPRRA